MLLNPFIYTHNTVQQKHSKQCYDELFTELTVCVYDLRLSFQALRHTTYTHTELTP